MAEYKVFQIKRRIKQLLMASAFFIVIIGGWRYPLLGYFIPLCMLLGIGIGFFKGRKWCDWFCPRGSFFDTLIKPISPKKEIPKFFKGLPFRIGFLSFLMAMMTIQIIKRWPDPYKIGMFFVILLSVTTIIGIILSFFFHQRTWCYFCPIGSMANWVGRRKYLLKIESKLCTECQLCYKACPIQVAPFKFKKDDIEIVKDGDCLKCNLCVVVCPKKALSL
ncbi:MAG: 4Fe-4S binding protein [Candidatus Omnitrophica bacterium]|nr:4Fe-4S binding protein [Candidatus Omnitrophota bacterium]